MTRCDFRETTYEQPHGLGTRTYKRVRRCKSQAVTRWAIADWHPMRGKGGAEVHHRCDEHPMPSPSWVRLEVTA